MRPLAAMPTSEAASVTALLFDLDDTVLTHGVLTRAAYDAVCDLAASGLDLVAVTGRPAGWGEVLARQWPLLGVVAENGAVSIVREGASIKRTVRGTDGALAERRARLEEITTSLRAALPELEPTDDVGARMTDRTFDIGERVRVPEARIEVAKRVIAAHGARAIRSSIHLHVTLEGDDKASGALRLLRELRSMDPATARARAAFVGDSENDAPCFSCFRTTVGVANVAAYAPRLSVPPRWVTRAPMGAGFAELAAHLLEARRSTAPHVRVDPPGP